jgi:hypothetical protein
VLAWHVPSLQSTAASISSVFDFLGLAVWGFRDAEDPWGRMDLCFLAAGQFHTRSLRQLAVYRPGSVSRHLTCPSLVNISSSAASRPPSRSSCYQPPTRRGRRSYGYGNVSPRGLGPPACKARLFPDSPGSRDTASRTRFREGEDGSGLDIRAAYQGVSTCPVEECGSISLAEGIPWPPYSVCYVGSLVGVVTT